MSINLLKKNMNKQILIVIAVVVFCIVLCVALGFIFVQFSVRVGMQTDTFEPVTESVLTLLTLKI